MDWSDRVFRANPDYELILLDRLLSEDRARVAAAEAGPDVYGVLRPQPGSRLAWRVASCDTALLFFTLRTPGPLPAYLRADPAADFGNVAARLTLDEVLQVDDGAAFVSGPAASELLQTPPAHDPSGRLADLSIEALRYAQALDGLSPAQLADRLYRYGQKPMSRGLRRLFPDGESVTSLLGPGPPGWKETGDGPGLRFWRSWTRDGVAARTPNACKLYVSPEPALLPTVFRAVIACLTTARGVRSFKVGRDLAGIARPDKLVVYFDRLEDLQATSAVLAARLVGVAAHGVPFTAEIALGGLLSWGRDPPPDPRSPGARSSWRLWVVERLAEYLVAARTDRGSGGVEPWRFALDRLALDGVDTARWVTTSHVARQLADAS
jgi:hypothetical protein